MFSGGSALIKEEFIQYVIDVIVTTIVLSKTGLGCELKETVLMWVRLDLDSGKVKIVKLRVLPVEGGLPPF